MNSRLVRRLRLSLIYVLVWAGWASTLAAQSYRITHFAGSPGGGGFLDGPGATARFNRLQGVATDSAGNVFVADSNNEVIRKISPSGAVTTLAGAPGKVGSADGIGSAARFSFPQGIAVDLAGNLYVTDSVNLTVRKITPDGTVTTLAGSPGMSGTSDGTGAAARFSFPVAIATDSLGNVYVGDSDAGGQDTLGTIRKITPAGVVTTLAGSASAGGYRDGTGSNALFALGDSAGLVADSAGNIFVADTDNSVIRKITPGGDVTTLAGTAGIAGTLDGTGPNAQFESPSGITIDSAGNLYVADFGSNTIRRVTPAGVVTTFAGAPNTFGLVDGIGTAARFDSPAMLGSDGSNLYVPDGSNNAVRKVVIATAAVTTLAGGSPIEAGSTDAVGTAARFHFPSGLATDGTNLYVLDSLNSTIRKVVFATAQVTTLAGTPGVPGSADGIGSAASFNFQSTPSSMATDGINLYIPDSGNATIRKIVLATGQVTTFAGTPGARGSTDGVGSAARFAQPTGIATDGVNLYVADEVFNTIRQIVIATGSVTTLAGAARTSGSTDGVGSAARFNAPKDLTTDGTNLYVVDEINSTIRKVVIATGQVTTIAGSPGVQGSTDGVGSAALFSFPAGVTTDGTNLYVTDTRNQTIRVVAISTGAVTTRAGSPGWLGATDGTGAGPIFFFPQGIVFVNDALFVADVINDAIRQGVCTADEPVSPVVAPIGNPTGSVTGIDFLSLTWSPPNSGLTPTGYDWAINGDVFTAESGTSVTAPPRGSSNPITLHVRGRACNPEVAGTAVDSPTYSPRAPTANFTASAPVSPGATVTFTDTSDPQATSWLWLFGDGAIATTQSATHTFSSQGIYSVVLVASNGAGSSEKSQQQTVQSIAVVPQEIRSTRVFDTTDPERQRIEGVRMTGLGSRWLHVFSGETAEIVVYLRFLDGLDRLAKERRLSIVPGQEALYDLGAYGLRGVWTLELVSTHRFEAFLEEAQTSDREKGSIHDLR